MAHIKDVIREALGFDVPCNPGLGGSISIMFCGNGEKEYREITLQQLQRLSAALMTERVSVTYSSETDPYSEQTGGSSSNFNIVAEGIMADLEFDQMVYMQERGYVTGRVLMRGGVLSAP